MGRLSACLTALAACTCVATAAPAQVEVAVSYLKVAVPVPPTLSNLDPDPDDLGRAGAELGLTDNATTGRFLGQSHTLTPVEVALDEDALAAARSALSESPLLVLDAPAETLLAVADLPEAAQALIFNVGAPDAALRDANCRANVLHTVPSLAMRTDALAQFLATRRWGDVALIEGTHDSDRAFAESLRRSLDKFGLRLRSEKTWAFDADMRRNATQEVPLFTQGLRGHDVLLVADETDDFGRYIAYNTWDARPVAGSEGLVPRAWAPVLEQWGAAQLQSRFFDQSGRAMRSEDYAAWAAIRAVGEAVTRTGSAEVDTLRAFLVGPDFELAGFKGRPLSFRNWNGQMRQPIPLTTDRAMVAMAPLEGFLHPVSELDTLGLDRPESRCTAFSENAR